MKTLLDPAEAEQMKARLMRLTPECERQWGKMTAAQMVTHCSVGLEMSCGTHNPPRMAAGRLLGRLLKPLVLKEGVPMRRNAPTVPSLKVAGEPDLEAGKARLAGLIEQFARNGAAGCTKHPHPFFGALTPEEWGALAYKHMDHHLRQFGV